MGWAAACGPHSDPWFLEQRVRFRGVTLNSLIAEALRKALSAGDGIELSVASRSYAFHCGEAGGLASAAGVPGVRAPELWDDISDAYETGDVRLLWDILDELESRRRRGEDHQAPCGPDEMEAPEFDAALGEALRSKNANDGLRYSLMIGFMAGLMFRHQDPEEEPYGPVRDKILRGYETGSDHLLGQAHGSIGFAVRMTDPASFASQAEARRIYQAMFQRMRRVQNFGLRSVRAGDPAIYAQRYLWINYRLSSQGDAAASEDA